jgi:hypothetical protein
VQTTRAFLESIGLPPGDLHALPDSEKRFPDGAQYRVEIPSTEGSRCLEAVVEEAERLDVLVHRVSQGSGDPTQRQPARRTITTLRSSHASLLPTLRGNQTVSHTRRRVSTVGQRPSRSMRQAGRSALREMMEARPQGS